MSDAPEAIRVTATVARLRSEPGPPLAHYRYLLDLGDVFRWSLGSTATDDGFNAIVPTGGGYAGAWLRVRAPDLGANITGTATIKFGEGRWRRIAAGALSANATLTISIDGAGAGDWIELTRLDVGAYTVALVNGGQAAGTLTTLPVSARAHAVVYFDGTNVLLRDAHLMI